MSSSFPDRPRAAGIRMRQLLPSLVLVAVAATGMHGGVPASRLAPLRVCADPNNLPFSNARGEGFENEIANLVAREMGRRVEYFWWAQRRGFVRNTLNAGQCDVVMGVPASYELLLTTQPYYRSSYVFVTRRDGKIRVRSFDDPVLRRVRVGVQTVGDDYANTPPAHALARRGIVQNVAGYSVVGNYSQPNPPARIIEAVARGEVHVAVAWGPLAGYFARRAGVALDLVPVLPQVDVPFLPFVYDIAMGVRRNNPALRDELNVILARRRAAIDAILDRYGVPRVEPTRRKSGATGTGA
jgi:mxaJ protein